MKKSILIILTIIPLFLVLFLFKTSDVLAVACQADTGMVAGDNGNPGLSWVADCAKSCSKNSDCPGTTDGYVKQKFNTDSSSKEGGDDSRWCYGFDGGAKCMQIKVKNPLGGEITCDGSPDCTYNTANPQVALNVTYQGLKECWDLGGAGTTCNYVGADLCLKVDDPALCGGVNPLCTADGKWKLVASGGNPINGKPIFPDGSFTRIPPSGGIGWLIQGKKYDFSLFEDPYTATKQVCSSPSDTNCLDYQYKINACHGKFITQKTVDTSGSASTTPTPPTPTPAGPTTKTAFYRVSNAPFGTSNDPEWKVYDNDAGMTEDLDFGDAAVGTKLTVYAQFKSTTGDIRDVSKQIDYIGPDPEISSIECGYSSTGDGTEVRIYGQNFGDQGSKSKVTFNNQTAQIISWGNQINPTASPSATPTQAATDSAMAVSSAVLGVSSKSTIVAKISDLLQEDQAIPVVLETNSGRKAPKEATLFCTIKVTTISFNTLTQCRPPANFGNSNVRVQVYEDTKTPGVKPVYDQKITINADGSPVWTAPPLEVGKNYVMIIRGPQGLGYEKKFMATAGTTVLSDIILPAGDIAPLASPDNVVNSLDYSELKREWNAISDVTRVGDFNLDNRINSIDYSCMRRNFNDEGARFLTGQ
ncbi:MAG: dockerin type I domain-containing protein [Candidatus Daviesbacteria bacterium]|nr:dockerin type I domain-containing protein [Candidatus Daviesbacteria bacterium]